MSEMLRLLDLAIQIMDTGRGSVNKESRVLLRPEWDELRETIAKAHGLEKLITSPRNLLQPPVTFKTPVELKPFRRNMPPPIKHH